MLEQACGFLYDYSSQLRTALLNNWLVNLSGLPGRWYEWDLLQEHLNRTIKRAFNAKNADFDSPFLADAVSLNAEGFTKMRAHLHDTLSISGGSSKHAHSAQPIDDIEYLWTAYSSRSILRFREGRKQDHVVVDGFQSGNTKLKFGKILESFKTRTLARHTTDISITRPDLPDSDVDNDDVDEYDHSHDLPDPDSIEDLVQPLGNEEDGLD
jgi:hypothetical protein